MSKLETSPGEKDDFYRLPLWQRVVFGCAFVAAGGVPMLAAFDFGPLHSADIHGPPWLGAVAGAVFVVPGLAMLAGPTARPLGNFVGVLVLAGLAALGNWIAFGAGERMCSGEVSFFWAGSLSGLACRLPFGVGALAVDGALCYVVAELLKRSLGEGFGWLERVGKLLLLAGLLPVLVPLLVIVVGRAVGEAVGVRAKTGAWPQNEAFIARKTRERRDG